VQYEARPLPKLDAPSLPPTFGNLDGEVVVLGLELVHLLDVACAIEEIEPILNSAP
jgi:hypothetical protein